MAAVFGGSPAAATALNLAMSGTVSPGLHGGIVVTERPTPAEQRQGVTTGARREVLRGGLTIGVLERIATAGTIIAGFPEGLAIVVAVKGVGRFTELEAPEARERFIIGTFASLIWACAAALVVHLGRDRHNVGDALLVQISERIGMGLRSSDMLARLSGDEFLLLLSPFDDMEQLTAEIGQVMARLKQPYYIDNNEILSSASIGVSTFPGDGSSYDALRANADRAMYRGKSAGTGLVQFFDADKDHK